ncbi:MAG: SRPBCC domain-containing protein [Candidatus Sumerlaeia bacterium]|nr:SRPBCC domain-containing protein [Candidatus Sumerlaeia bacterium]
MADATRLVVTRHFAASCEAVFDAWLDPDAAGRWLFAKPDGTMKRVEIDARVGGRFLFADQRGETLVEHQGEYLEIDRPRRLVFSFAVDATEPATRVTIELEETNAGCRLTLSHAIAPEWADFTEQARKGWTMILDGLAAAIGG